MPKIVNERANCPKYGSDTYAWGHSISTRHFQRYRCKNQSCRRQFTPGVPERLKKYPTIPCPKCGGRMSIFKFLTNGYKLRCNNHIHKGKSRCNHKLNVPFSGKNFKTTPLSTNLLIAPRCI